MIKHFLLSKNFWVLNKQLVKELGIESAFLLSVFADADETLSDEEGWFYQTVDTIEALTTLNRYKQDLAINILIEKGVLEKTHKGMPRKRYFRIDSKGLAPLFVEGQQTSQSNISELVGRISATSKELNNKELNNKEIKRVGKTKFSPPSLEEVTSYCLERNNTIDPQAFIDFYESKGWYIGKNKMKDWKSAVRTWERRDTKTTKTNNVTPMPVYSKDTGDESEAEALRKELSDLWGKGETS